MLKKNQFSCIFVINLISEWLVPVPSDKSPREQQPIITVKSKKSYDNVEKRASVRKKWKLARCKLHEAWY